MRVLADESYSGRQAEGYRSPGAGQGGRSLLFLGYRVSVWDAEQVLETDDGGNCGVLNAVYT